MSIECPITQLLDNVTGIFFFLVGGGVGKVLLAVEPRDSGISLGNALLLSHTPNMSRFLWLF